MSGKKTTLAKNGARRMTDSEPRQGKGSGPARPAAAQNEPTPQSQLASYGTAMRLFRAGEFAAARAGFEEARRGPGRDVANSATLHIQMCGRRLREQQGHTPESAEDHYNLAVALLNSRDVAAALGHLGRAVELAPDSDHIQYAMALACALSGDLEGAHRHLGRAIELEPRNRIAARQDADFAPFIGRPPLAGLVYPESRSWGRPRPPR